MAEPGSDGAGFPPAGRERPPIARRTAVAAGAGYLIVNVVLALGDFTRQFDVGSVHLDRGTSTDVLAPLVGLIAALVASAPQWRSRLTPADSFSLRAAAIFVSIISALTLLLVDWVAGMAPLLVGAAALLVMRAAQVERARRLLEARGDATSHS